MSQALLARASITIGADASKVWDALTNPALIKKWLFGTEAVSDWKVGSPIVFTGEWEGKRYEDKGRILEMAPGRLLRYTFWSSFSGLEDKPENYAKVSFELSKAPGGTRLDITQDGSADEKARDHSQANWNTVLAAMKNLLEG